MILVRTNPKLAVAILCITLFASMFTVWRVTSTTDKVAQQGIELQQQAQKSVDNAINAAKTQPGVSTDAQAQLDAAQKQLEAATAEH